MNELDIWIVIGCMVLATLVTRCPFFLLGHAVKLPPKVQHALRYAPAAALAAIVIPDLALTGGVIHLSMDNPRLLAGIGAVVFFLWTRRMLATLVLGMGLFTVLRLAV
ncbi:AzlD domain-containing protein [Glaciimonas sp. PCH181]|uniref:AzlD domain-containing protein n=1 Tax=Glaciimonas sp. PCH181 TaxID=2133943 RepID=UPI000D381C34|nr:AzlD domain-containing protein [Glaciimonas sp. PCH181]PUA17360.1 branched-chain amino acid transporter [Glaciimonas sp. PCH181]